MQLPGFEYLEPRDLNEALDLLGEYGADCAVLAGGTDLIVRMKQRLKRPRRLMSLKHLDELDYIREADGCLKIGAATTLDRMINADIVHQKFPGFHEALTAVGARSIQHFRGTLGGNLCQDTRCVFYNQSAWWRGGNGGCLKVRGDRCHVMPRSDRCHATYHGDIAPVAMVLGAEAEIAGPSGTRRIPLESLYRHDGRRHLTLVPGELLTGLRLGWDDRLHSGYEKARVRGAVDFPLAGVAISLRREDGRLAGMRLAVTGTNPSPLAVDVSGLEGRPLDDGTADVMVDALGQSVRVVRTTVMGVAYRRRVLAAMARRLVGALWRNAV